VGEDLECPEWGFTVKELTEEMATRRRLRDDRGVLVTGIKSRGAADRSELLSTDSVIEFVQQQPVEDLAAFGRIYQQLKEEETSPVILKVRKGRDTLFVLLEVDYHQPSSPEPETAAPEEDS